MTVDVRRATPDDLSGVLAVFLDCWRMSYRGVLPDAAIDAMTDERAEALWTRLLAESEATVLVAEQRGGEVVGLTRFALVSPEGTASPEGTVSPEGYVHSLYVSPHSHGGGIGKRLLSRATDELRAAGAHAATLYVFADNAPSIGFYEAQGWMPDGVTRMQPEFGALEQRMRKEWA